MFDEILFRRIRREVVDAALDARLALPAADDRDYLSLAEAAKLACVSQSTIKAWVRRGTLKRTGPGRRSRFRRADVVAILEAASDISAVSIQREADKLLRKAA